MLRPVNPSHKGTWIGVAPANLLDWQAMAKSFEAVAGSQWQSLDLTGGDRSERLRGLRITPEFFNVLDVQLMGDTFNPAGYATAKIRDHHWPRPVAAAVRIGCKAPQ